VGSGPAGQGALFPHHHRDFDLESRHEGRLVKSLVLDKRRERGALSNAELQFKADRDETENPFWSEGTHHGSGRCGEVAEFEEQNSP